MPIEKKAFYGLPFKASAETVTTIAADAKRAGARVGMTSVLHTWGTALTNQLHTDVVADFSDQLLSSCDD